MLQSYQLLTDRRETDINEGLETKKIWGFEEDDKYAKKSAPYSSDDAQHYSITLRDSQRYT